jgi:hypothetical protein
VDRRLLLICLLFLSVLFVTVAAYYFTQSPESSKPYWLMFGNYMTYEQAFTWNDSSRTEYMTWNVTGLTNDTTDIYLVSHGVNVNAGNVTIVMGEANWTINTMSREVLASSTPDYIGQKWAFWIPTDVKVGSTVDIWYGANTVSASESINVLGQQRDCWVLEYNWPTSSMKRWYDKSSGICLKILVVLNQQNVIITTTETAMSTNINLN